MKYLLPICATSASVLSGASLTAAETVVFNCEMTHEFSQKGSARLSSVSGGGHRWRVVQGEAGYNVEQRTADGMWLGASYYFYERNDREGYAAFNLLGAVDPSVKNSTGFATLVVHKATGEAFLTAARGIEEYGPFHSLTRAMYYQPFVVTGRCTLP